MDQPENTGAPDQQAPDQLSVDQQVPDAPAAPDASAGDQPLTTQEESATTAMTSSASTGDQPPAAPADMVDEGVQPAAFGDAHPAHPLLTRIEEYVAHLPQTLATDFRNLVAEIRGLL